MQTYPLYTYTINGLVLKSENCEIGLGVEVKITPTKPSAHCAKAARTASQILCRVAPDTRLAGHPALLDIRYPAGYPVPFAGCPNRYPTGRISG